ncbi:MAG: AAA family ATPase [Chitinivibrionales bacterium]|nr:AAA family ATPase [Chitinivibrionales bacterium]
MEFEAHWHLKEKPFEELADAHFFFESDDHREALDRMLYVAKDRNMNMGLLTGEIGSGKTITRNVFKNTLPRNNFEVIIFENSNFTFCDIIFDCIKRISLRDPRIALSGPLQQPSRDDKYHLIQVLKEKIDVLVYEEKRHLIVIFDEAQLIEPAILDEIRSLTNISSESANYLTIFFVGQPELREKIRNLQQLDQRIFLRFHLNNLDFTNTVKYIQHRLRVAGHQNGEIFTSNAYELIFRKTEGVPRRINRLCKLALSFGYANNSTEITHEDIDVILEDMNQTG